MKLTSKFFLRIKQCFTLAALWAAALFFYVFITYFNAAEYFSAAALSSKEFLFSELSTLFFAGVFMGISFFVLQEFVYPHFFKYYGILATALLQSVLFFLAAFLAVLMIFELNREQYIRIDSLFLLRIDYRWTVSFTVYCLLVHLFLTVVLSLRRRLGKSFFKGILRGNYMVPVVEYRIFMFLDMQSSTAVAEVSGHYDYSLLLQECFSDLSEHLEHFSAEVYQFVGDEAVLTWKVKDRFERSVCIGLFDAFKQTIEGRKAFYENRFGFTPRFKASVNEGLVTAAEIGRIKTEIAYHGDVLSTAARVRDLCNYFEADMLVTDSFYEHLNAEEQKKFSAVESQILRGKKKTVGLFRINS